MRITGGILAGRSVAAPPGILRPSMDRMRESVFAVLGDLAGASFLDLFSGSGVIALEAASRGAAVVEAVEAGREKAKILMANVSISPAAIRCRFISAELYIKRARRPFDLIFCDPPFSYRYKTELLVSIGASPLMRPEKSDGKTTLLIHRPKSETIKFSAEKTGLEIKETRYYGNSAVDFINKLDAL